MANGIEVKPELDTCDILFGIKEVPVESLIPEKMYFFFSHTIKRQIRNRSLLQEILRKKITLVDYECLVNEKGERTVAFGRFAGIVGAYNALRIWMYRFYQIRLKAAGECGDMEEMLDYARHHTSVLGPIRIVVTGTGRVGQGALEVLRNLGIPEVSPERYLSETFNEPVFTCLSSKHYMIPETGDSWDEAIFRQNPSGFRSRFMDFAAWSDIFISCHFWDPRAPALFSREEAASSRFRIRVISDVTCDLNGSIPTTLRTSTTDEPFFDLDPKTFEEKTAFSGKENLTICSVDNLPTELPLDASRAFGEMLKEAVIPELASGIFSSIEKATIAHSGLLTPRFAYLQEFVDGK